MLLLKASKIVELYVGNEEGLIFTNKLDWAVLHLSRKFHYKLMGWNLNSAPPRDHPNYLTYFEDREASINVVNGDSYLFEPLGIQGVEESLTFLERHLNNGKKVYIQCQSGKHISNSLALLYLSKRLKELPPEFHKAKTIFLKTLPSYKPGGFELFLKENWHLIN